MEKPLAIAHANIRRVELWETETGPIADVNSTTTELVDSIAFSPDGRTLASGSNGWPDYLIELWDAQTGKLLTTFTEHTWHV